MKKVIFFFAGTFCFLLSLGLNAQNASTDFFIGGWNVLIVGTPNGDAHTTLTLKRVDGKLSGDFKGGNETAIKLTKVEEKADEITVYFTSSNGYDVNLRLKKKDDSHVEGSMMDMFDASGVRVVEEKK